MTRTRTNWKIRDHVITIGERTLIMGVLNVTPDSFSDGGKYFDTDAAVERAMEMESQGADIIDIGAESTRPGSERINAGEELRRLVPVLKRLKGRISVPISVDTYKVEVAEKALEHGASIINDISALTWEPDMVKPVVQYDAGLILNHMRGTPETWARLGPMKDVMSALLSELEAAIHRATRGGVPRDRMVIDPGIGFGKRGDQNHEILARLEELQKFALPVLVAVSRKSFLGNVDDPRGLEFATAAAVTTAILHGAAIVRVHDVAAMRSVVQAADAIIEATPEKEEKARPAKNRVEETIEEKRRRPVRPTMQERPAEKRAPAVEPVAALPAAEVGDAESPEVEVPEAEAPVVSAGEDTAPPRRPFERRAEEAPRSEDRPERGEAKTPEKKFYEWRTDRDDNKKPSDRRARPAGPKEERGRDDRAPRPPFRRSDAPSSDRPERRPYQRAEGPASDRPERRPYQRADAPGGDRPERRPYQRSGPPSADRPERRPYQRSGPPSGDRPERRPYERSGSPARGRDDREPKPYERRGAPPAGPREDRGGDRPPPRKPYQRADDDRRSGAGARGPASGRDRGGDRPDRRPAGGRPAFSPRDGERGGSRPGGGGRPGGSRPPSPGGRTGGRPAGPRNDDRGDRPTGGPGSRPPSRGGSGGGSRGPAKRPGGGAPPRGPRKRS